MSGTLSFCPYCGRPVLAADQRFCGSCGRGFDQAVRAETATAAAVPMAPPPATSASPAASPATSPSPVPGPPLSWPEMTRPEPTLSPPHAAPPFRYAEPASGVRAVHWVLAAACALVAGSVLPWVGTKVLVSVSISPLQGVGKDLLSDAVVLVAAVVLALAIAIASASARERNVNLWRATSLGFGAALLLAGYFLITYVSAGNSSTYVRAAMSVVGIEIGLMIYAAGAIGGLLVSLLGAPSGDEGFDGGTASPSADWQGEARSIADGVARRQAAATAAAATAPAYTALGSWELVWPEALRTEVGSVVELRAQPLRLIISGQQGARTVERAKVQVRNEDGRLTIDEGWSRWAMRPFGGQDVDAVVAQLAGETPRVDS